MVAHEMTIAELQRFLDYAEALALNSQYTGIHSYADLEGVVDALKELLALKQRAKALAEQRRAA